MIRVTVAAPGYYNPMTDSPEGVAARFSPLAPFNEVVRSKKQQTKRIKKKMSDGETVRLIDERTSVRISGARGRRRGRPPSLFLELVGRYSLNKSRRS